MLFLSVPCTATVFEIIGCDLVECPPDMWIFGNSNANGLNLLVSTMAMAPFRHREDGSADGASSRHHGSIGIEPKVSLYLSLSLSLSLSFRHKRHVSPFQLASLV